LLIVLIYLRARIFSFGLLVKWLIATTDFGLPVNQDLGSHQIARFRYWPQYVNRKELCLKPFRLFSRRLLLSGICVLVIGCSPAHKQPELYPPTGWHKLDAVAFSGQDRLYVSLLHSKNWY